MYKTLPLLCVFIFNAFAQCVRIENSLYSPADYAVLFPQSQIECVVWDKPDYFAPVSTGNDFSAMLPSGRACASGFSSIHTAILSRYNAFYKTVMAKQRTAVSNARRCMLIAYVKTPLNYSSEDVPLSIG